MAVNGLREITRQVEIAVVGWIDQRILICCYLVADFIGTSFFQVIADPDFEIAGKSSCPICTLCVEGQAMVAHFNSFKQAGIPTSWTTVVTVASIVDFQMIGLAIQLKGRTCNTARHRTYASSMLGTIAYIAIKIIKTQNNIGKISSLVRCDIAQDGRTISHDLKLVATVRLKTIGQDILALNISKYTLCICFHSLLLLLFLPSKQTIESELTIYGSSDNLQILLSRIHKHCLTFDIRGW